MSFKSGMRDRNHRKAFSLIELMVVIAIIGLLSTIVIASLNVAEQKGRDSRRISDIKQIQLALELYYDANQTYPADIYSGSLAPAFIPTVPMDPNNFYYAYVALQGYATGSTCGSYHLGAKLEQSTNIGLSSDFDATVNGTYGSGVSDGAACSGSSYDTFATNHASQVNIAATGSDFAGTDGGGSNIYDLRP